MNRVWNISRRRCLGRAIQRSLFSSSSSQSSFHHRSPPPPRATISIYAIQKRIARQFDNDNDNDNDASDQKIIDSMNAELEAAELASRPDMVVRRRGILVDRQLDMLLGEDADESARVLSYWIADPNFCISVLARPNAIPRLLTFILLQQQQQQDHVSVMIKGKAMLVSAMMDVVTSNCDQVGTGCWQPLLATKPPKGDVHQTFKLLDEQCDYLMPSAVGPGLCDYMHPKHVAFRFAAWALATWTITSERDKPRRVSHQDMEFLGYVDAPSLLEDNKLRLRNSPDYESTLRLLSIVSQACKTHDTSLAHLALTAILVSIESSPEARVVVMEEGQHLLREAAKLAWKHKTIQVTLTRILDLLCQWQLNLPFKECLRWSGILLPWVFGSLPYEVTRSLSIDILSRTLEYYGPLTVPITQAWLAMLLNEISTSKIAQPRDSNIASPSLIANQLAAAVVSQVGNQFGTSFAGLFDNLKENKILNMNAVDCAAATSRGIKALADRCAENPACLDEVVESGFLCVIRRLLLDDDYEQLVAAEAYHASQALKEEDDSPGSDQVLDYPTILLVQGCRCNRKPKDEECISWPAESNRYGKYNRHQVAAIKAYLALRSPDGPERACPPAEAHDATHPAGQLVPHATHIRRHASRLLAIVSDLPKVKNEILGDVTFRKWLEDCSEGKLPECNDHEVQTNARASLLKVFNREKGRVSNLVHENVTLRPSTFSSFIARIENSPPETLLEFASFKDADLAGMLEEYKALDDGSSEKDHILNKLTNEMRRRKSLHNSMHMVGLMLSGREKSSSMSPLFNDHRRLSEVEKLVGEYFHSPLCYGTAYLHPYEKMWNDGVSLDALKEAFVVVAYLMGPTPHLESEDDEW